ncbi:MAG: cyclic nucleotide-binding domain-containing protein [Desulforhabdus sp.]|jgi:CRP/FNR family transcriptional regulator|nr:cyclic nucleotide-binding domain-containing protein [Desulforhabdus sp.]
MDSVSIAATLKKCELFSELSDSEIGAIAGSAITEQYGPGELIYEQGCIGRNLYILAEGQVSLERHIVLGKTSKANVTVFIQRETPSRRLMGSWSTLVGERHVQMCSAKCNQPTTVVCIPCSALSEIVAQNPQLRIKILEKLVIMLRDRIASSYEALESL